MVVILALRSASSDSNCSVAVLASPLVVGWPLALETCCESSLFFSSKSDTLTFNASNSFEEVVLDAPIDPLGPVVLERRVEVLGREERVEVLGREERLEIPVAPLAAAEMGRPAADGGLGEIAFSRAVEAAEGRPAVAVLDGADIEGRDRCEGAVGVVVEVAALLTLLAVLEVLPPEDRRSAAGLVELLELGAVPFFSGERVAFAAGGAIADVLLKIPDAVAILEPAAGGLLGVLLIDPETVLRVAVLLAVPVAPLIPTADLCGGFDKLVVTVLRGGGTEAGAAELDPVPAGRLAVPVTVGFLAASFCSSRWVSLTGSGSAEDPSPITRVIDTSKP